MRWEDWSENAKKPATLMITGLIGISLCSITGTTSVIVHVAIVLFAVGVTGLTDRSNRQVASQRIRRDVRASCLIHYCTSLYHNCQGNGKATAWDCSSCALSRKCLLRHCRFRVYPEVAHITQRHQIARLVSTKRSIWGKSNIAASRCNI